MGGFKLLNESNKQEKVNKILISFTMFCLKVYFSLVFVHFHFVLQCLRGQ